MMSFGDDLKRLAGEIVGGREMRTALISGMGAQGRENRAARSAMRGDMRNNMRTHAAESAAARSAERGARSAEWLARSAELLDVRKKMQSLISSDTAKLRQTLGAGRQGLAGTVGTLRATLRTVHAKTSTDLRDKLGGDLAKMRGDMGRQFAAARSMWRGDGMAPRARSAPPASSVGGGAARGGRPAPRASGVSGPVSAPSFVAPVMRKDTVAPPPNTVDVATAAKAKDSVQRVA
jgi:hypothetical protein